MTDRIAEGHWKGAPADREDDLDRLSWPALKKLEWACQQERERSGRDPRGGGYSFVARPAVIAQIWSELPEIQRDLQKIYVYGQEGSDIVMFWNKIPIVLRTNVVNNSLHLLKNKRIPDSKPIDRKLAGDMRVRAARGLHMVDQGGMVQ